MRALQILKHLAHRLHSNKECTHSYSLRLEPDVMPRHGVSAPNGYTSPKERGGLNGLFPHSQRSICVNLYKPQLVNVYGIVRARYLHH